MADPIFICKIEARFPPARCIRARWENTGRPIRIIFPDRHPKDSDLCRRTCSRVVVKKEIGVLPYEVGVVQGESIVIVDRDDGGFIYI